MIRNMRIKSIQGLIFLKKDTREKIALEEFSVSRSKDSRILQYRKVSAHLATTLWANIFKFWIY